VLLKLMLALLFALGQERLKGFEALGILQGFV
jgi:hypothetical protein